MLQDKKRRTVKIFYRRFFTSNPPPYTYKSTPKIYKIVHFGMGRVLCGPSWHGPSIMWAELAWAE